MKLHYSQTMKNPDLLQERFYYLMKLHYSQTTVKATELSTNVLLPYEITLFSNIWLP